MRATLIGPSWPQRGGIARTTTALAAALAEENHLASFLVPSRQYPRWLYPGHADEDPEACPHLAVAEPVFAVLEPWTWPRMMARVTAGAPDCLVLPFWTWAWAPLELYLLARARRPAVAIVHNLADHDGSLVGRVAARMVLRRCAGYFCHAESVAHEMRRRFPGRPTAVHPLPPVPAPAVDRGAARRRLGVAEETVVFLCFGLIRAYKGVDLLLEAFAALPRDCDAILLIAGEPWGGAARAIARRIQAPHLAGRVVARLEWIPEREVAGTFAAADVVVLPYRSATGSAVAAQALGWGRPVLATAVGGIPDVIRDGGNGMLVPAGDVTALTAAMRCLLDADHRARLADGAACDGRRWNWRSYAGTLLRLLDTVCMRGDARC